MPDAERRVTVVTGAAGFAGGHLVSQLAAEGPVEGWYRPGAPPPGTRGCDDGVTWRAVDLRDAAAVSTAMAAAQPLAVYHLAGAANQGTSWADTDVTFELNALVTHVLLRAVQAHAAEARVLVTTSAAVYRPSDLAVGEDAPLGPISPYGVSKLAQEMVALRAVTEQGLDVVVVRPFNHIGPGQDASFVAAAFARQLARIEAGLEPPRLLVGNLQPRRDVTDVRDTVRGYRLLMARAARGEIYNVCGGVAFAISELLDLLRAMVHVEVAVDIDATRLRPSDQPVLLGNRTRLTALTGWVPHFPIAQTLREILDEQRHAVSGVRD